MFLDQKSCERRTIIVENFYNSGFGDIVACILDFGDNSIKNLLVRMEKLFYNIESQEFY